MPKTYDFEDFCQITAALRKKEGGCPWDLIQTHESLKPYMVSETAEALAAVDLYDQTKDSDNFQQIFCPVFFFSNKPHIRHSFSKDVYRYITLSNGVFQVLLQFFVLSEALRHRLLKSL